MSEGHAAEQGFFGGIRLALTVFGAGFLPPFLIVWLLTSRSQNQLLAEELGLETTRTTWELIQPMVFASAVALAWVLGLSALLLVVRSFGRVGELRDLRQRRATDKALARDTQLPADAWGEAVVRRREGAVTAPEQSNEDTSEAEEPAVSETPGPPGTPETEA